MQKEYYMLKFKEENLSGKMKALIERILEENSWRISFKKDGADEEDYPVTTALYGRKGICFISITDVYMDNGGLIYADGIDDNTGCFKTGFKIEPDQYSGTLYFIGYVLGWSKNDPDAQSARDVVHSDIMELACELAEKEMVDTPGRLPEDFMKKDGGYKDYYQAVFNPLYDKYYGRLAQLAGFEYVVAGIREDGLMPERITCPKEGSGHIRTMDEKELPPYPANDTACDLEKGIYRVRENIDTLLESPALRKDEVIRIPEVHWADYKGYHGEQYKLNVSYQQFGGVKDGRLVFHANEKMACIHWFRENFHKINGNQ